MTYCQELSTFFLYDYFRSLLETKQPVVDNAKLWKKLRPTHHRRAATQRERIVGPISAKNSAAQIVESGCAGGENFDLWWQQTRLDYSKANESAKWTLHPHPPLFPVTLGKDFHAVLSWGI